MSFRGATVARLNGAGLVGPRHGATAPGDDEPRRAGKRLGVVLDVRISMWAQLSIGWQWSAPSTSATTIAMIAMSACVLIFAVLGVTAAVPIVAGDLARLCQSPSSHAVAPPAVDRVRRTGADCRRPTFRQRVAGYRRPPVGPPRSGPRRSRGIRVGFDVVRDFVLGPSVRAVGLSADRAGLDVHQPACPVRFRRRAWSRSFGASTFHPLPCDSRS